MDYGDQRGVRLDAWEQTEGGALRRGLRRLDRLSPLVGLAIGGGVGLAATYAMLAPGHWAGVVGGVALLGGAAALAFSGEPVLIEVPRLRLDQPPEPVGQTASPAPVGVPAPPARTPFDVLSRLDMVDLPGGEFLMSSSDEEQGRYSGVGPRHRVRVGPFAMARTPVTQQLYEQVMGENPSFTPHGAELPVNQVSWHDSVRFCNRLSELAGLVPCYVLGEGEDVTWERVANGYRLPTEAEWEYAARAGTQTAYPFGDDPAELAAHAWLTVNASGPQPVGQKRPNPWGLHDLLGNVWEWCWDRFGSYASEAEGSSADIDNVIDNPTGSLSGPSRVLRGGSFLHVPQSLRAAIRDRYGPTDQFRYFGFRCVRSGRRQL